MIVKCYNALRAISDSAVVRCYLLFFRRCISLYYYYIIFCTHGARVSRHQFFVRISTSYSRFIVGIRKQYCNTQYVLRTITVETNFVFFLFPVNHYDRPRRRPFIRRLTDKRRRLRGMHATVIITLLLLSHTRVSSPSVSLVLFFRQVLYTSYSDSMV